MQYSLALLALAAIVTANPVPAPQAVTAVISPSASAPPGCTASVSGSFGIAVHNVSTSASGAAKRQAATQVADGQPQLMTMAPISMITDGQVQGGMHTMMMMPVANEITDGQIQIQTQMAPVTEFKDGQPQAPTVAPTSTAPAVSQMTDAQPIATAPAASAPASSAAAAAPAASSAASSAKMITCAGGLSITLADGVLKDQKGRTGYIASNYQFQFDGPPQAGAIYTAGFSVCGNGSLALGGSNVFYQCLSGSFYNLYDRSWAAQCSPVTINALMQVPC